MPYDPKKLISVLNDVFSINNDDLRTMYYNKHWNGKGYICKQEIVHNMYMNEVFYSKISSCVEDNNIPIEIFLAYMEEHINNDNTGYKEIIL